MRLSDEMASLAEAHRQWRNSMVALALRKQAGLTLAETLELEDDCRAALDFAVCRVLLAYAKEDESLKASARAF